MAKSKKRRKVIVFSVIAVVLLGLTALVIFKKREVVITVQTEKVTRRNLTEIVTANGKIQPVLQVKISPEVSGEIIELPVKEGQKVTKGDLLVKIKPEFYIAGPQPGQGRLRVVRGLQGHGRGQPAQGRSGLQAQPGIVRPQAGFRIRTSTRFKAAYRCGQGAARKRRRPGGGGQGRRGQREGFAGEDHHRGAARRHHQQAEFAARRARAGHRAERRHRDHDHRRPERDGGAGGHRRE